MCRPPTITQWKCPSWFAILWTSNRTPANVKKKETEAMNMRRRGRSGIVVRTRNPSRVNCSSTSRRPTTTLAKASNKSAPVPGIPLLNHLGALPRTAGCQNRGWNSLVLGWNFWHSRTEGAGAFRPLNAAAVSLAFRPGLYGLRKRLIRLRLCNRARL